MVWLRSWTQINTFGNAIVRNAFAFTQVEMTGSIWLLEPEPISRRRP